MSGSITYMNDCIKVKMFMRKLIKRVNNVEPIHDRNEDVIKQDSCFRAFISSSRMRLSY